MMHYSKNPRYSIFLVFTAKFKTSMALYILRLSLNFLCNVYFLTIPLGSTFWLPFQVKFDQFVEQGRVLHNYASILELLLRLRQCCDHPFLVMRYAKNPCSNAFTFFFFSTIPQLFYLLFLRICNFFSTLPLMNMVMLCRFSCGIFFATFVLDCMNPVCTAALIKQSFWITLYVSK